MIIIKKYTPVNAVFVQFIREYTSKVDELVKDRIEAQNEVKTKEKEEKDLVSQQVYRFSAVIPGCVNFPVP